MNLISLINEYGFLKYSVLISILSSICCGIIGTYIVNRKMVYISSSLSHASYGGIGIGIYLTTVLSLPIKDPLIFGIIFSIFCGILIILFKEKLNIQNDLGIGIIMSFGMAIGIIFSFMTPGYQNDLSAYLFGNILMTSTTSVVTVLILDVVLVIFFIIFYKSIIYTSFDEVYYKIYGVPTTLINYVMIIFVSIAIIVNIKIMGIVLITSILTMPQAISLMLVNNYVKMSVLSILFSLISMLSGLYFSYSFNIPTGPSIVITLIVMLILVKFISHIHTKKK